MKTLKELGITQKQFNNLLTLAKFLDNKKNLPKDVTFNMLKHSEDDKDKSQTTCGNVGDAIGFAPFAGIEKLSGESWLEFAYRSFVDNADQYNWMFSYSWKYIDNTPKGASKRIMWFLTNGVPENFDRQRYGIDRRCYTSSYLK